MATGRRPFEHVDRDAAVIQKVLTGNRPFRPTVGFSDPLWELLAQTWLEERESSPPIRPEIATILEQLQYEAEIWSPGGRLLAPPMQDRKASCMSPLTQRSLTLGSPENPSGELRRIFRDPGSSRGPYGWVFIVIFVKGPGLTTISKRGF